MSFTKEVINRSSQKTKDDVIDECFTTGKPIAYLRELLHRWKSCGDEIIKKEADSLLEAFKSVTPEENNLANPSLLSKILSDCNSLNLQEREIEAIKQIKKICKGENYPQFNEKNDNEKNLSLSKSEWDLIKQINNSSPFNKHKLGEAVELSIRKNMLSDEPLGCYVRPGILKVKHNVPEFIDHPKIVLYKDDIADYAKKKDVKQEYITSFVYLYQLCRLYFDRYPYANLLEYKEWDVSKDKLQGIVNVHIGKVQDSIVRNDIVSSIERPIIAMAALYYATKINLEEVSKVGLLIINNEDLCIKWHALYNWHQNGLALYNWHQNGQKINIGNAENPIELYRDTAILLSSEDAKDFQFSEEKLLELLQIKRNLLK